MARGVRRLIAPSARTALGLTAVLAVAVGLRACRLAERSVWFDEAVAWRLASFPCAEVIERVGRDNNPPLYHLLLKLWMACFGQSAVAMRSLSVLAGAASCVGVYLTVAEAYRNSIEPRRRQWMGMFAAALVAVTVLQVRWGWESRMYALGAALVAFSSWLLLRALHSPLSARSTGTGAHVARHHGAAVREAVPWLLYAAVALAFAYTHTYAQFSVAAQAVFAARFLLAEARCSPKTLFAGRRFRLALVGFALVAAGWLPWLPVLVRQTAQVKEAYWTGPLTRWSVPAVCHQIFADPENRAANHRDAAIAAGLCALVLAALLWRPCAGDWFLLVSTAVPLAMAVVISAWVRNILSVGCFIFAQLFLLAALARLVCRIAHWPERTIVAAMALGGLLLLHIEYVERLDVAQHSGLRESGEHIAARRRPGEPVVVVSPYFYLPLRYHLADDPACRLVRQKRPFSHFEGTAALTEDDYIDLNELSAFAGKRVWVVGDLAGRPSGWREISRAAFFEGYGIQGPVVVREYQVGQ